jgi:hypothetical protein
MRTDRFALLLLVAPPALAHHSAAMFDATQTVTLEGSIERYEWANPHVYIHLASSSGTWIVEAGSPSLMQRVGWTPDSFAVGDVVSIDVNPTRNAERLMARGLVVRPLDGAPLPFRASLAPAVQGPAPAPAATPAAGLGGNWLPGPFVAATTESALTPKGVEALARADRENNPGIDCVALQSPSQMLFTDLKNIEIDGTTVLLRSAVNVGVERIVHLDQTTHVGAAFTNDGHSIGRLNDGTLVVDTRNFSDHPSGNRGGVPSGAQKHLVEYFELSADRTTLTYRFKLEDPEYLAAPVEGSAVWAHRPDLPYTAEKCDLENARRYLEDPEKN